MKSALMRLMPVAVVALGIIFIPAADGIAGQNLAQGAWFGRAVPIGPCTPGTPGCPLPPELFMVLNIYQDGSFIGHDSLTFGAQHTTAHGQWFPSGPHQIVANYVVLAGSSSVALPSTPPHEPLPVVTPFAGAFRMRWLANVKDVFSMEGFVNVYFFPFVNPETGLANIDPDTWIPKPDPLMGLGPIITDQNLSDCKIEQGCLGIFRFKIRRVSVP